MRSSARVRQTAEIEAAFSVAGVSFSVDQRELLHAVSLDFAAGEVSALVGHNGSGKSTLLRLLARQVQPSSGQIRFGDTPLNAFDQRAFARSVAYLPQELSVAPGMTVRELVSSGRYPWHGALGRFTANDYGKVEEALALTHIEGLAHRLVETLSGGERQRAWIAMLIAQDARCLLLDEPTSALDIAHQIELLGLIRRLSREKALSVIIVLHDINMAARFSDRIYALKAGSLMAAGVPAEIMTNDTLARIYGIRMEVMQHPLLNIPLAYVC